MRDAALLEKVEDAHRTAGIELCERIIEEDDRCAASATKRRGFEQSQRDRCRTLLASRAERA